MMNTHHIRDNWSGAKGKAKQKFTHLVEDDLEDDLEFFGDRTDRTMGPNQKRHVKFRKDLENGREDNRNYQTKDEYEN